MRYTIFPMEIGMLVDEHCIHDNSIHLFHDILASTLFKLYKKYLLQ